MRKEFLNLGRQPLANSFINSEDINSEFFYDLKVVWDSKTCLVSLKDFVKPNLMFNDKYKYHTSLSTPMIQHYEEISDSLQKEFNPSRTDLILKLMILSATYELMFSHKTPVNVIVSEYVKISDFFLESAHKGYLNAVLDKISQNLRKDN